MDQHPELHSPTDGLLRTFTASLVVLFIGLAALLHATDGGAAFTTESVRRSEIARAPKPVPDFLVHDSQGRRIRLHELASSTGKVWIVDFVYTRCQTICSALGTVYQQLQTQILARGLQEKVGLLSISFDTKNDDALALRQYAKRMRLNPSVWNVVTLASERDRPALLDAFGIMVVPAPYGEFEHNAAFHLVDDQGLLVQILDLAAPERALQNATLLAR